MPIPLSGGWNVVVLGAWHQRHVEGHLAELARILELPGDAASRLQAVLRTYALVGRTRRRHGDDELAAVLHRNTQVRKQRQLLALVSGLVAEAAEAGAVRRDVPAVGDSSSAVDRLIDIVWTGISSTTRDTDPATAGSGPHAAANLSKFEKSDE